MASRPNPHIEQEFDWLEHGFIPVTAAAFGVCGGLAALFFLQPIAGVPFFWWTVPWMLVLSTAAVYISQASRMTRGPESLGLALLAASALVSAWFASLSTPLVWTLPAMAPQAAPYVIVWVLSASSGVAAANVSKLEDFVGDQASSTLSWQQESAQYTLGFFAARLLALLLVAGIATGLAAAFGVSAHPGLSWSAAGLAFFGLILQSASYLQRLRIIWAIQELDVHELLARRWLQASIWVSALLTALILLLPANWLRIPWQAIGQWLSDRMQPGESLPPPAPPPTPAPESPAQDMLLEGDVHWLTALAYMLFFAAIIAIVVLPLLALVGFLVAYFLGEERAKLPALLQLPVAIYERLRSLWQRVQRSLGRAAGRAASVRSRVQDKPLHQPLGIAESAQSQELFQLFLRLRQEVHRQTSDIRPGTTPRQIGWRLARITPGSGQAVQVFLHHLHQARYSHHELTEAQRQEAHQLYEALMGALSTPETRGEEQ